MESTVRLFDPSGRHVATLKAPTTPETLLRHALGMAPADTLVVCMTDTDEWSLAVLISGVGGKLLPIGPKVPAVPRHRWAKVHRSMIETTWLNLVDQGWMAQLDGAGASDVPISFQGSR